MLYDIYFFFFFFFFSSRRRHTRWNCDWSSDVCSSDLTARCRAETRHGPTRAEQADLVVPHPPIRCTGLVKRYADVVAVAGRDLTLNAREGFGLLGPNGAGKTTTIQVPEGLTAPDAGDVEILGRSGAHTSELQSQ